VGDQDPSVRLPPPLPARVGPVEFAEFGRMVAVHCPKEFAHIVQRAGGAWEPGSRRWLVERRTHVQNPVCRRACCGITYCWLPGVSCCWLPGPALAAVEDRTQAHSQQYR